MKALYECKTRAEEIEALQALINSGQAWQMEGSVGRAAMEAIRNGECILGTEGHYDFYGNYVPSRTEVKPGTKGSIEYQQEKTAQEWMTKSAISKRILKK